MDKLMEMLESVKNPSRKKTTPSASPRTPAEPRTTASAVVAPASPPLARHGSEVARPSVGIPQPTPQRPSQMSSIIRIGSPTDISHEVHVARDDSQIIGLSGLPPEWLLRLSASGLTGAQISTQYDAVICALKTSFRIEKSHGGAHRQAAEKLQADSVDPRTLYTNMVCLDTTGGGGDAPQVFRAICNSTCSDVAIKKLYVHDDATRLGAVQAEIQFLEGLDSPSIVRYIRSHYYEGDVWIVMELMELGALADYLPDEPTDNMALFDEATVAFIMWRVLEGVMYLHDTGRMHRDIKSDNVCVSSQGDIKLTDFGVSCYVDDIREGTNTVVGTTLWMAPEVVRGDLYGTSADMWSVGILLLELVQGNPPYMYDDPVLGLYNIVTAPAPTIDAWAVCSADIRDFLGKLLVKDPAGRSTARELIGHPFLAKGKAFDQTELAAALLNSS